jgi:choline dehydrogenase-like flavoprotein
LFLDASDVPPGQELEFDLCLCGGGVAGISLALELAGTGLRTCLLESGALAREGGTQDLYGGRNLSPVFDDGGGSFRDYLRSSRSRFLGGSSNCWGGWCRPYDEIDFARRPWVAHSGWPISRADLQPYYERAHGLLQLGPPSYDAQFWRDALGAARLRVLPLDAQRMTTQITQFSPPSRLGRDNRAALAQAADLLVFLHANVTEVEAPAGAARARRVQVRALSGARFAVRARFVVLCAGGIENARILLASQRDRPAGLGNEHDLVGRFFMEHAAVTTGLVRFAQPPIGLEAYDTGHFYRNARFAALGTTIAAHWAIAGAEQERQGVLNSRTYLRSVFAGDETPTVQSLVNTYRWASRLYKHRRPRLGDLGRLAAHPALVAQAVLARRRKAMRDVAGYRLEHIVEACPDPQSRVTLDRERDRLGVPRAVLDWRPGALQKRTMLVAQRLLGAELARLGLGAVEEAELPPDGWPDGMQWVWHHLGTTRMHEDPRQGVVDAQCRVHGLDNLYIAGGSVFPTAGTDAPTLTIVALALRLADHLKGRLRGRD